MTGDTEPWTGVRGRAVQAWDLFHISPSACFLGLTQTVMIVETRQQLSAPETNVNRWPKSERALKNNKHFDEDKSTAGNVEESTPFLFCGSLDWTHLKGKCKMSLTSKRCNWEVENVLHLSQDLKWAQGRSSKITLSHQLQGSQKRISLMTTERGNALTAQRG